jgi:hypothetical protein
VNIRPWVSFWPIVLLAVVAFFALDGHAAELGYNKLNDAAVAALTAVQKRSPFYEFGGMILQRPDGQYVVNEPTTDVAGDHTSIDMDPASYTGYKIAASYHTHPCIVGYDSGKFSPPDMRNARITDRPAFIDDLCTGDVHLYNPGDKPVVPTVKFADDVPEALRTAFLKAMTTDAPMVGQIVGNTGIKSQVIDIGLMQDKEDVNPFHQEPIVAGPDCGQGEVEFKGDQGITCLNASYFDPKQNWSQGELSKAAPELDGTCPSRYAYKVGGLTLFCWGSST